MTDLAPAVFPVIALCSSAGGLDATSEILSRLPGDFPAAIVVAQHRAPDSHSWLAEVLRRRTELAVRRAVDRDALLPGQVLVVPEAKHMLVGADSRIRLIDVNGLPPARPSVDLLLSTLAVALCDRAIGVVLSGGGHDGALGAQAVTAFGGYMIVQDENSAEHRGMPVSVVTHDEPVDAVPPAMIADWLQQLVLVGRPA
jgi:two-component system, chemotaxis family, protein-glutamate methylesterase/glutaminase